MNPVSDQEEISSLLAECPKHVKRVVTCAINTGMRKEGILSLKWNQIRNGFIYLTDTKTKEQREVPIYDELAELFEGIRKEKGIQLEYVFTYRHNEDKIIGIRQPRRKRRPAPLKRLHNLCGIFMLLNAQGLRIFNLEI